MTDITCELIYEDDHVFVALKPSGLHSVQVADGGESLADHLLAMNPSLAEVAERAGDAGLVQRLDYSTSGLILGGKTRTAWELLRAAVQEGGVKKRYVSLVTGAVSNDLHIMSYIGSPYRGGKKVRVYEGELGKKVRALPGETTLSPLSIDRLGNTLVGVAAFPARRHQIRVHAAHLGHPLVGDTLYGCTIKLTSLYNDSREFFLHCESISFRHPISHAEVSLIAPYEAPLPRS